MNKLLTIIGFAFLMAGCASKSESPTIASVGFQDFEVGKYTQLSENGVTIQAEANTIEIRDKGKYTPNSLLIVGGESKSVEIFNSTGSLAKYLNFFAERWTSKPPFHFKVDAYDGANWVEIYKGDQEIGTGHFPKEVLLELPESTDQKVRITSTAIETGGVLIDDIVFYSDANMQIDSVTTPYHVFPVLKGKEHNPVLNIQVNTSGYAGAQQLEEIVVKIGNDDNTSVIDNVMVGYAGKSSRMQQSIQFGEVKALSETITFSGIQTLTNGVNNFWVACNINEDADINTFINVECVSVKINGKTYNVSSGKCANNQLGIALRQHKEDGVDTYRIPGLATTNNGTLIGVYDIRYNSAVDLQEDVDVGMSRSTDGGQTWEPMKIIMDMGEWGGLPEEQNGIGDPSVLVDRKTNTIWVAAVWAHGHPDQRNWWASRPGLEPETTSQFVLVKSEDDGITWSRPINITKQIKDKDWNLLLQGPGKGITLDDGTLVFPAQFKDKEDMPYSTIIYSKDNGQSWSIGAGAKTNTTEAQLIELNDGGLMLNMRDNRNGSDKTETNGRAVAVTYDLGKTWQVHATSNGALKEPTCMASLIKEDFIVDGDKKSLVLFSNPNSMFGRHHMTIKISLDDGKSWPEKHQLLIDSGGGRGYSCMTKIDDHHIGILYEGSQADLIFQKFAIKDILQGN